MQVELFNRRKRKTRIELASAIHDYSELSHNTQRRQSALQMRTPSEVKDQWLAQTNTPVVKAATARTPPTVQVDERADAGLSDARTEPVDETINIS